jgi:hypothetical protein
MWTTVPVTQVVKLALEAVSDKAMSPSASSMAPLLIIWRLKAQLRLSVRSVVGGYAAGRRASHGGVLRVIDPPPTPRDMVCPITPGGRQAWY